MKESLKKIWNNKALILEGIQNTVFKTEFVEAVSEERMSICNTCPHIGTNCIAPGTDPCCGKCGCSLAFKTRALSAGCGDEENPRWHPVITSDEEDNLNLSL